MRRLLSLAVMAGLAAPIGASAEPATKATTDTAGKVEKSTDKKTSASTSSTSTSSASTASNTTTKPIFTAEQAARLPDFMRTMFENAGLVEKPAHPPWLSWWMKKFGIDPYATPTATTASR